MLFGIVEASIPKIDWHPRIVATVAINGASPAVLQVDGGSKTTCFQSYAHIKNAGDMNRIDNRQEKGGGDDPQPCIA
ncbi:MAG: hypothetical protein HKP58_14725 [Desulfatitalea sp.]|nr:hypothetical protein [Desulfatitalea sp.]NNK01661.1 hypothetical protein [Desulfatitalea sp.]